MNDHGNKSILYDPEKEDFFDSLVGIILLCSLTLNALFIFKVL